MRKVRVFSRPPVASRVRAWCLAVWRGRNLDGSCQDGRRATVFKGECRCDKQMEKAMNSLRVLVVVDEANLMGTARTVNKKPDWKKIREYLASKDEGRELVECVAYIGLPPLRPDFAERREAKLRFVHWLRTNGFMVASKDGTPTEGTSYKANVDVLMAIDTLALVESIRPDVVVMVTGDSDFAYLAQILRRRGIRVEAASLEQNISAELTKAVNGFIDLREVLNQCDDFEGNGGGRIGGAEVLDGAYEGAGNDQSPQRGRSR